MAIFDIFKKKAADDVPPDVGKEVGVATSAEEAVTDAYDPGALETTPQEEGDDEEVYEDSPKSSGKKSSKKAKGGKGGGGSGMSLLELEKINARLESLNSLIKGYSERFSAMNQQIGELRGMSLTNEKTISKVQAESARAIDVVNEVKPERIRFDYQRIEAKIQEVSERAESTKQFMDSIMNELKDLRRKAGIFIGTEALLKLNDEVKKDLVNVQQISAKAKMHADKAEQLFIEARKSIAEYSKMSETVSSFEANYGGLKKDIEKLKVDYSNIATQSNVGDLKKYIEGKVALIVTAVEDVNKVKEEDERVARMIETTLSMVKQDKEDIADIAITIGDDHIKRASDYDARLNAILKIIDTLAGQIVLIKKKVHLHTPKEDKVVVPAKVEPASGSEEKKAAEPSPASESPAVAQQEATVGEKAEEMKSEEGEPVEMQNVKVHHTISKHLRINKKSKVSDALNRFKNSKSKMIDIKKEGAKKENKKKSVQKKKQAPKKSLSGNKKSGKK